MCPAGIWYSSQGITPMSDPWFRFFPSDWISGVSGLSAAERGVYVTLLALMYDANGPLKRDDSRLSRQCGLPKAGFVRALESLIETGKIVSNGDGCLFNNRAKNELTERENRTRTASDAATSRWEKEKKKQRTNNAKALPKQCQDDATRARIPQPQLQPQKKKEDSEEDKSSSGAGAPEPEIILHEGSKPDWWPRLDKYRRVPADVTDKIAYDVGRILLGKASGGLVTRMHRAYRYDWRAVVDMLMQAEEKSDPKTWFIAAIRRAEENLFVPTNHEISPEAVYR
jgi:uncharacterized protein YdaU (DUF1376 family)